MTIPKFVEWRSWTVFKVPRKTSLAQMLLMASQMKLPRNFVRIVTVCRLVVIRSSMRQISFGESFIRKIQVQSNYYWKKDNSAIVYLNSFDLFKFSRNLMSNVVIFYDDHLVHTLKRSEVLTFAGFLSMCGGLLGLFLGISALSIIELIYYATLDLFFGIHRRKSITMVLPVRQKDINTNISVVSATSTH